jgi:protease-4
MKSFLPFGLILAIFLVGGCSRMRFVIDAVPAEDELTETAVLKEDGAIFASKVAIIDLTGLIADAESPGLIMPGENPVARFAEALHKAETDSAVKAVILRINSPGGTVTGSDVVYREVQHFKKTTRKPVVVLMEEVAASGGYYVACAADEIIAHPTTVTGSIGVIIQTVNVADGLSRIGIRAESITSGPNKAMGSPLEPMPEQHRALLQELVDEFYSGFKEVVVSARPSLKPDDLEWVTDGRVVTGRKAAEVGLVDRVGDLRDAFAAAKSRANLQKARLVKYHRPIEHVGSAYSTAPNSPAAPQINLVQLNLAHGLLSQPGFYYLWDPAAW